MNLEEILNPPPRSLSVVVHRMSVTRALVAPEDAPVELAAWFPLAELAGYGVDPEGLGSGVVFALEVPEPRAVELGW